MSDTSDPIMSTMPEDVTVATMRMIAPNLFVSRRAGYCSYSLCPFKSRKISPKSSWRAFGVHGACNKVLREKVSDGYKEYIRYNREPSSEDESSDSEPDGVSIASCDSNQVNYLHGQDLEGFIVPDSDDSEDEVVIAKRPRLAKDFTVTPPVIYVEDSDEDCRADPDSDEDDNLYVDRVSYSPVRVVPFEPVGPTHLGTSASYEDLLLWDSI